MTRTFKEIIFVIVLVFSLAAPVTAGPAEDANAASRKGDYETAMRLWLSMAEQGNAAAQNNVGAGYDKGLGVPQNHTEAVKWYGLSADQGDVIAQNNLAAMYANGLGVPQDLVRAHMWFNLAATRGSQSAAKSRDRIQQNLTPDQLSEATKLAREWKPIMQPPPAAR